MVTLQDADVKSVKGTDHGSAMALSSAQMDFWYIPRLPLVCGSCDTYMFPKAQHVTTTLCTKAVLIFQPTVALTDGGCSTFLYSDPQVHWGNIATFLDKSNCGEFGRFHPNPLEFGYLLPPKSPSEPKSSGDRRDTTPT